MAEGHYRCDVHMDELGWFDFISTRFATAPIANASAFTSVGGTTQS